MREVKLTSGLKYFGRDIVGLLGRKFLLSTITPYTQSPIFMFHRVVNGEIGSILDDFLYISPSDFEDIIKLLKKELTIVSLHELAEASRSRAKVCAITFDDGWLDNYTHAFPILRSYAIPATIFLCAGMVGTYERFWFERTSDIVSGIRRTNGGWDPFFESIIHREQLRVISSKKELLWHLNSKLKTLHPDRIQSWLAGAEAYFAISKETVRSVMDLPEILEMSSAGISFGSHGMNHTILPVLSREEKKYEISGSMHLLRKMGINFVPVLSFPNGNYDQETIDIAEESGYEMLLTASIKRCGEGCSGRLYRRLNISNSTPAGVNQLFYRITTASMRKRP